MSGRLDGKVALITGAGSVGPGWGNGRATAVLFAREGARVVALDRDTAAAEATRQIIESEGNACAVETADVTDSSQIERVMSTVCEHWGALHVLVNNVGGSVPGGPVELSEEDWAGQLDFNLTSAFLTTRACCRSWRRRARAPSSTSPRWPGSASSATTTRPTRRRRPGWCSSPRRWPCSTQPAACAATRSRRPHAHTAGGGAACRPVRRRRPRGPGREAARPGAHGPHGLRLGRGPRGALSWPRTRPAT